MSELKVQERTIYWNISAEKRAKVKRMKRKLAGWLLVGLPIAIFVGMLLLFVGLGPILWIAGAATATIGFWWCIARGTEFLY